MDQLSPLPRPDQSPHTATLRRFVLLTLAGIVLAWTLAQSAAVRMLVTRSYEQFEQQDGMVSARRLDGFLTSEFDRLMRTARDWGYWDDTLEFIRGERPDYVEENLGPDVYQNLALDLLFIADASGRLLHQHLVNGESPGTVEAASAALMARILSSREGPDILGQRREISGFLRTPGGLFAVVAVPVLDSKRAVVPAGILVFGRAIGDTMLADARQHNVFEAELFIDGEPGWPADVDALWGRRAGAPRIDTAPVDGTHLGAYVMLSDLDGVDIGVLRSLTPRDTKRRFEAMGRYLLGISLLLAALMAVAALWTLERRVLAPIAAISRTVGRVARDGDLGQRVELSDRHDELSLLGREINAMLVEIANQQHLREARDHALAASAQKSEFLANMSHEIRTPMNGILGMLELVLETDLTTQQQERVQTAHRSAKSLLSLLNDILDLSKLEAGKLQLEQREFDLRESLESVVTLFAPNCEQKGIAVSCHVDSSLGRYLGDPLRIQQLVSNLLGNAVKFTAQGEVTLEAVPGERPGEFRIDVTDTGIGIPEDQLQRLFQPFTQVDASMARRYGGTGLGLAICRQLVDRMNGRIEVTSTPGVGTCFSCLLRLKALPAPPAATKAYSGRRALVYGPADGTRRALVGYLRALGFDVLHHTLDEDTQGLAALSAGIDLLAIDDTLVDGSTGQLRRHAIERGIAVLRLTSFNRSTPGLAPFAQREQTISRPVLWHKLVKAIEDAFAPLPPAVAPTLRDPGLAPLSELRGRRVLLVEDNVVNQALALGMLDTYDLVVECAESGIEALDKLEGGHFDLVLMDCQMPEMDGLEATRRWREHERVHGLTPVPIVALTANAMTGDREACLAAGMDGYLAKPFNRAALTDVLRGWIRSTGRLPEQASCLGS